jgi:hypothetical protein
MRVDVGVGEWAIDDGELRRRSEVYKQSPQRTDWIAQSGVTWRGGCASRDMQ